MSQFQKGQDQLPTHLAYGPSRSHRYRSFLRRAVSSERADRQMAKGQELQASATDQDVGYYLAKDDETPEGLRGPLHGSAHCSQGVGTQQT